FEELMPLSLKKTLGLGHDQVLLKASCLFFTRVHLITQGEHLLLLLEELHKQLIINILNILKVIFILHTRGDFHVLVMYLRGDKSGPAKPVKFSSSSQGEESSPVHSLSRSR
ncbi:unnamed protein product, partial [Ilex paraguariensis]